MHCSKRSRCCRTMRKFSIFSTPTTTTSSGTRNDFQSVTNKKQPSCGLTTNSRPFNVQGIGSYELTGKPGHERAITNFELPVDDACCERNVFSDNKVSRNSSMSLNLSSTEANALHNFSALGANHVLLLPCDVLNKTSSCTKSSIHSPLSWLAGSDSPSRRRISLSMRATVIFISAKSMGERQSLTCHPFATNRYNDNQIRCRLLVRSL